MAKESKKDPIEEFFEQKLQDFEISYREADWSKLEARLDGAYSQRVTRRRIGWLVAASVLLFGSLSYFSYQNYVSINNLKQQIATEAPVFEEPVDSARQGDSPVDLIEKKKNPLPELLTQENDTPDLNSTLEEPVAPVENKVASLDIRRKRNRSSVTRKKVNPVLFQDQACEKCNLTGKMASNQAPPTAVADGLDRTGNISQPIFAEDIGPLNTVRPANTTSSAFSRLSIGVSLGSDVNAVNGFSSFESPGHRFGVKAEYSFTSRFSAIAGIQQSNMQYSAGAGEYSPPRGFWTNGIAATGTNAQCRLLDISLALKYNYVEMPKSRLFITGGVSNNIMVDEQYSFEYENQNGALVQGYNGSTGTQNFINNVSVSLGYEYDLDTRFGIRFEPFLKVPIRQVGFGSVNLYSMGTSVSFRYNIGRK